MTTALVGGLLGLFGTALGAALTTWTARQTGHRSERMAREEAVRSLLKPLRVLYVQKGDPGT